MFRVARCGTCAPRVAHAAVRYAATRAAAAPATQEAPTQTPAADVDPPQAADAPDVGKAVAKPVEKAMGGAIRKPVEEPPEHDPYLPEPLLNPLMVNGRPIRRDEQSHMPADDFRGMPIRQAPGQVQNYRKDVKLWAMVENRRQVITNSEHEDLSPTPETIANQTRRASTNAACLFVLMMLLAWLWFEIGVIKLAFAYTKSSGSDFDPMERRRQRAAQFDVTKTAKQDPQPAAA